jgi:hypothetical protein
VKSGGPARAFRWALSVLTVLVVARILQDWFHERQHLRQLALNRQTGALTSYAIAHTNSSLLTHLCLVAVIALGILQIALIWIWQSRLARRWWVPPLIEVVLCSAFAVVAAQVLRHYASFCTGGTYSGYHCVVTGPNVLSGGWIEIWAVVGLGIGFLWTFTESTSRHKGSDQPPTPYETPGVAV